MAYRKLQQMRKKYKRYKAYYFLKLAINQINAIQKTIFSSYLDPYYADNTYWYEKKLHQQRIRFFSYRIRLPKEDFSIKIDGLFEIVTLLGSLRYQIADHTTLTVCEKEFKQISKNISITLNRLFNENCDDAMTHLLQNIDALESIYYSAFQVVCKNPAVFLIFIQNLHALYDELTLLDFDLKSLLPKNQFIWFFPFLSLKNFFIYFYRADVTFRKEVLIILTSYNEYFTSIIDVIFKKKQALEFSNNIRFLLEKKLVKSTPLWVYGNRLGMSLRPGHQHFLIMLARAEQILFCIHYIAKYPFNSELIDRFYDSVMSYAVEVEKTIQQLTEVLSLSKVSKKVNDLSDEVSLLERILSDTIPSNLELLDISKDYIYLVALVENFKDLRLTFSQLMQAVS